jgi:hypothetical protein
MNKHQSDSDFLKKYLRMEGQNRRIIFDALQTDEEKRTYLRENKLWFLDLIVSFATLEQVMMTALIDACDTDEAFLTQVLPFLEPEELDELEKISTCMMFVESEEELPPYLAQCGGKYFFNTDVNKDADTAACKLLLETYIAAANESATKKAKK